MDEDDLTPDSAAARAAVATCLRHLACGWALHPTERKACLRLLQGPLPGAAAADIEAAQNILTQAGRRRLGARTRDRASALAVRLAEFTEAVRSRLGGGDEG